MIKKIVFLNHWNNGDLHNCRGFVRKVIEKVRETAPETEFIFSHKNDPCLLSDIPFLQYDGEIYKTINPQSKSFVYEDVLYINSWYDQAQQQYPKQYGIITIDVLYAIFDDVCRNFLGFSLTDVSTDIINFYPWIDYPHFEIENVIKWTHLHRDKTILIENGPVLSGQAHNFDMGAIIEKVAQEHPDKLFILSARESRSMPANVFYTSDIIQKKNGSDLNEISFLSQYCDLIIGKASGVFAFSLTQENLFESKKKYLCFSHLMAHQQKFWLGRMLTEKINYSADITISNESNANKIQEIINNKIGEINVI